MSKRKKPEVGQQLALIEVGPENLAEIAPVVRRYRQFAKERLTALAGEVKAKQELLDLVKAARLQPLPDGKITFTCEGATITVTPQDFLIQVKDGTPRPRGRPRKAKATAPVDDEPTEPAGLSDVERLDFKMPNGCAFMISLRQESDAVCRGGYCVTIGHQETRVGRADPDGIEMATRSQLIDRICDLAIAWLRNLPGDDIRRRRAEQKINAQRSTLTQEDNDD